MSFDNSAGGIADALEKLADGAADAIVEVTGNGEKEPEDYWAKVNHSFLKAVILLACTDSTLEASLNGIYDIVANHSMADIAGMFERLPEDSPARKAFAIVANCDAEVREHVKAAAAIHLQSLVFRKQAA